MKNKYILLTFLFVLFSSLSNAQKLSDYEILVAKRDSLVNQVRQQKTDTIITYYFKEVGSRPQAYSPSVDESQVTEDSLLCEIKDRMHVIWLSQGETFISQLHPCFHYKTEILDDSILDFIKKVDLIKAPPFKPFQTNQKGQKKLNIYRIHTEFQYMSLILGKKRKKEYIDEFALKKYDSEDSANGEYNINANYESNLKNPWNLFAQTIATAVKSVKFKKDN